MQFSDDTQDRTTPIHPKTSGHGGPHSAAPATPAPSAPLRARADRFRPMTAAEDHEDEAELWDNLPV
ncbi:hypothetical protein AQS8620_02554 [Aquimixticola soesokkakensis]|uniref:Uncharacterized protein n=1 Tax=Aquimixticola soesokkakensis TaxID=1519096 RepID=A0A1Y5T7T0_9RHOB|nr:hypothetical protein [Aquimixticola soesokkakensis]SLN57526.1 hypothetical protein AQS8620_02554 [Aquimixticola soesokkakensis]